MEILAIIRDTCLMLAAIIASCVGVKGLAAWRKQLKGTTEYNVAKQLLKSVYKLRESIIIARGRFIQYTPRSSSDPDIKEKETDDDREWNGLAHHYNRKIDLVVDATSEIKGNLLEAKIIWGEGTIKAIEPLFKKANELLWAIDDFIDVKRPHTANDMRKEVMSNVKDLIYSKTKIEDDKFRSDYENIITDIETEFKPIIKKYHK